MVAVASLANVTVKQVIGPATDTVYEKTFAPNDGVSVPVETVKLFN